MKIEKTQTAPLHHDDVSGTLLVQEDVDTTTRKMLGRLEELDSQITQLQREKNSIMTTLTSIGYRTPEARPNSIPTKTELEYQSRKPFRHMSLTDACLKVLRDRSKMEELHEQWLDKAQVEYLVVRGGYPFDAEDSINSVQVTLRRLVVEGLCQVSKGKGSRPSRYHFLKDREQ